MSKQFENENIKILKITATVVYDTQMFCKLVINSLDKFIFNLVSQIGTNRKGFMHFFRVR